MLSIERLKKIEEMVRQEEFITITELSNRLGVSESTVRRDLLVLEKQQIILRSQSGVMLSDRMSSSLIDLVSFREKSNVDIKIKIGIAAAGLIEDGDSIFLDSSTTVLEIAKHIKSNLNITAVTNDLMIALELEKKPHINTVVIGGSLRQGTHSLIGPIAESNIKGMYINKMFMSPGGISLEGHIMNYNLQSIELRKKVMSISDRVIIVTDSSKFNRKAFITSANFDQLAVIVTDKIPEEYKNVFKDKVSIILAE